ncbi:MAG: ATP-grasp domain-containing protein [Patescibacteria group bacterium]|nr:ATP-grasp domain-containing protein [Patescibacteria group bacterium]
MNKTLLIISGGMEAIPGIIRAKKMGLHVVVSDGNPQAPGFEFADDRIVASTYDIEATVDAAKKYDSEIRSIDGVICIASDVPLTVATVSSELGLSGIPIESAKLASDKLSMKKHFAKRGIPIPWFQSVESVDDLSSIVSEREFPLVIKPVDSRGARGVLRLVKGINLEWAFQHAKSYSATSRVMVEEYLEGPQFSTESILTKDWSVTPGFCERNYDLLESLSPYVVENGGQQPSSINKEDKDIISKTAERAALELGIITGTAKGDMVLTQSGPKVIELAARLSGGWFSTDQIPLATGVDFVGIAIKVALGEYVGREESVPKFSKGVAIRYFFPNEGKIIAIKNAEKFSNVPWIYKLNILVKPGDCVESITNHTKRAGFVIATGSSRDEAVKHAQKVINTVQIETMV